MIRRSLLSLVLCLAFTAPGLAAAQEAAPSPAAPSPVRVAIETTAGTLIVETDPRAPITSANFLRYVDEHRFDGTSFYRGMEVAPGVGLIQGGTQNAPDRVLPPIAHESTRQTGLHHVDGALSMARFDPGSATGDFFIIVGDLTSLDAGRSAPDDPGFAVFGHVVEGMEVVRRILAAPKSPTEGEGFMRGQMLEPRVTILSVRRVEATEA
jgi:peptidyl-prolyl cis-trans isomerase A (cyclophilin A)